MQPELIPEASRRWDDFQGGRPIELPDGQEWRFCTPEPHARLAHPDPHGPLVPVPSWTFGEHVDSLLDQVLAEKFAAILSKYAVAMTEAERTSAILEAAWFLLARNYNLSLAEFEGIMLLGVDWSDDRQIALGHAIGDLVDDVMMRSLAHTEAR